MKFVLRSLLVLQILYGSALSGQTQQTNAVPFISEVTPPSLPPASASPGNGTITLTILGANFPANAVVNLVEPGNYTVHPQSTVVNASGSQIVAQFSSAVLPSPATMVVTVTNPNIGTPSISNSFYLPVTPSTQSVAVNQNTGEPLGGLLSGFVISDFTGNGTPGVAVLSGSTNTVTILSSNFGGPFSTIASYPTGSGPTAIVAADFQGGGIPDLAIANGRDNTVSIFFANGGGTFRPGPTIALPYVYPTQLIAADFNGDGKMDLAVLNTCGTGSSGCIPAGAPQEPGLITILLGNGDGTFTIASAAPKTGVAPFFMAAADLNGDGFLDLVVSNSTDNTLTLLMGNGDGTFTPTTTSTPVGFGPQGVAIGDFNGDGKLDIAVANNYQGTISILLNQNCSASAPAACSFVAAPDSPAVGSRPYSVTAGDLNADGLLDLVVGNYDGKTVSVLVGEGTGTFHSAVPNFTGAFDTGSLPTQVGLGDFNQDGRLDIFAVGSDGQGGGIYTVIQQSAAGQVVFTTGNASPSYGQSVDLTAQLNAPFGQPQPTGYFNFYDGSTQIGQSPLNGYQGLLQYSGLSAGPHQITAIYSGDVNYVSVTSNAVSETVGQAQTTLALSADVTYTNYGQAATFTATIQQQNIGTATGSITFTDTSTGIATLGVVNLANNTAQLRLSNLKPGTHAIVASYQGDSNYLGSTSSSVTETVSQATTAASVTASINPASYGQIVTLSAAIQAGSGGNPTGTVTFSEGSTVLGTSPVSDSNAQLALSSLSTGSHAITAAYSGDTNFSGSTSPLFLETVNAASSAVALSASANPSAFNQNVTFTAIVQAQPGGTATGSITFLDGGGTIGSSQLSANAAQFSVASLGAGSHSITARYSGDSNYAASTSAVFSETVNQATTTTVVTSSANPANFGQPVIFSATVAPQAGGSATGNITIYDGTTSLGTVATSSNTGQLTASSLSTGTHSITAKYSGDANFASSTSTALSETVSPATTAIIVTANANPSTYGQSVTFTATMQPQSGGNVTGGVVFLDGTTALGNATISSNTAQLSVSNLTGGSHSITVKYFGDANYASGTSAALNETVNPVASAVLLGSNTNPSSFGQTVVLTATVQVTSGSPTGNVTFYDGGVSIGSAGVNGGTAVIATTSLAVGAHSMTARYGGDTNVAASTSSTLAQTVNQSATSVTLSSAANPAGYKQAVQFAATVQTSYGGSPTGTVTFFDGGASLGSVVLTGAWAQLTVSNFAMGSHLITARYNGDSNFTIGTSVTLTETVTAAATTTGLSLNSNPSPYGQATSYSATVTPAYGGTPTGSVSFYEGGTLLGSAVLSSGSTTLSVSGMALAAGTHALTAKYSGDANYGASTSAAQNQTVNPAATSTTITSSLNPSTIGQSVTFTAHVSSAVSGTLTGTMNFYVDGSTNPAASVTVSGGSAQYTTNSLAGGSHSIIASFASTNSNFAGSSSSALMQNLKDFALALSPVSQTISRSTNGIYTLTVTPLGGFIGNVSLNCSGAPASATCNLSSGSVTLNGSNSTQVIVTVKVGQHTTVGNYTMTLKGASGSITQTVPLSLVVN